LTFDREIEKSLRNRYKIFCSLSTNVSDPEAYQDIEIQFSRNNPENIKEETEVAGSLEGVTSRKTQLSVLSFVPDATEEIRLYNLTMKINRLEMLKAEIGLDLVNGFDELEKLTGQKLNQRTIDEFKRQAGILGKSVYEPGEKAKSIVGASYKNATFSDRIWMYQDALKNDLGKLLQSGMVQGRNPRELARQLRKSMDSSRYASERLLRTELARVQTEAQKQSFEVNGYDEFVFISLESGCDICRYLDGEHWPVSKMMVGENAPPIHPHCRCSVAAYEDDKAFDQWLDTIDPGVADLGESMSKKNVDNDWSETISIKHNKEDLNELEAYAKSRGVKLLDKHKFDGDFGYLKDVIDLIEQLRNQYPIQYRKDIPLRIVEVDKNEFGSVVNHTINVSKYMLRSKEITTKNLKTPPGLFSATDYLAPIRHEYGHLLTKKYGKNRSVDITKKVLYNLGINADPFDYLINEVSESAVLYDGSGRLRDGEICAEIFAKHTIDPTDFTTTFMDIWLRR
jgi:SPP1 gp7 family putative phage head morphogenesis protein